jgi:PAS domain S-box-containing protein
MGKYQSIESNFQLLEDLPVATGICDIDGNIRYVNSKFTTLTGYGLKELLIFKSWTEIAFPEMIHRKGFQQYWLKSLNKVSLSGKNKSQHSWILVCKNKSSVKFNVSFGLFDKDLFSFCFTEIISENNTDHNTLNASDGDNLGDYYRQIVTLANVAIVKFSRDMIITDFLGNSENIFGYKKQEVIGKSLDETIVPKFDSTGNDLGKLMKNLIHNTHKFEYNINENKTKDGKFIWMQWYNTKIKDERNRLTGILSIGIDITNLINTEFALKESEERFKKLSNLTFEGILIHDNGIILDCNLSFERQIGYRREELMGANFLNKLIPSNYHAILLEKFKKNTAEYEIEAIHKDGTIIPISIVSRKAKIRNKVVRVAAIRNISDLKRTILELDKYKNHLEELVFKRTEKIGTLNKELKKSNKKIRDANSILRENKMELESALLRLKSAQLHLVQSEKMASIGILTAGIAHEINNPINFVYTGVNSLRKDFDDIKPIFEEINLIDNNTARKDLAFNRIEELKKVHDFETAFAAISETLEDIKTGATRISEIVAGLGRFSRFESEKWKKSNLHDELNGVLILLKNKYKYRIEIIKKYYCDLPEIECYPGKLNQVFMNILSNAIDAIESQNGIIEIETCLLDGKAIISIKDNGKGIKDEDKLKIFDPFFTTKEVGYGMGLGLAISYSIIQEHHGEIAVNSSVGIGTEFIIKIPVKHP